MKELEMVVSREVKRRRNRSFYLFPFWPCGIALIFLQLLVPYVEAANHCSATQFWMVHDHGTILCEDCGSCPPGQGLSHECGKQISSNAMVTCVPCQAGISFSSKYDTSSCTPCGAPCSEDQVVLQNCTPTMNVECNKQCYSEHRYYDDLGSCLSCSKCCGDNKDVVEKECKQKLGAASSVICSFHSSLNRCDTTTVTLSTQETTTVLNTTTPMPFTLTRTRDATKTLTVASTHQSMLTQGAESGPHQSKAKQDVDNSANVTVIISVIITIGLLIIIAGGTAYHLYSRGRCSCPRRQHDTEMAIQYSPDEGVACQNLTSIDNVKLQRGIMSAESSEPLLSKESSIPTCSHQEIKNTEKVSKLLSSLLDHENALETICVCLDTAIPGCGHYKEVAQHYGFDHYKIIAVLEKYPGGPTRALIEKLAATHTDLTVKEFATVVNEKTTRKDVLQRLKEYDSSQD